MRYITFFILTFIVGCDSLYGLRMPVIPAYDGDWSCVTENISSIGLVAEQSDSNQLSISTIENDHYLFSVKPNYSGKMQLYFMQIHAAPSCKDTTTSLIKMEEFINLMEQKCNYLPSSYSANMECSSNKSLKQDK